MAVLLRAVPGSVVWLPQSESATMANLAKEVEARGVPASQLVFAPLVPAFEDHWVGMQTSNTTYISRTLEGSAHTHSISPQGSGTAFSIVQPYLCINFIIKY